ncbi:hypothetical protein Tco_0803722 [Tanacetum coccineum]|uniref:Uncharacterized protein n=1 Tax=Tanacetum coccineum TaxID=301880 RepID=A0ABQ5A2C8_9ASTR
MNFLLISIIETNGARLHSLLRTYGKNLNETPNIAATLLKGEPGTSLGLVSGLSGKRVFEDSFCSSYASHVNGSNLRDKGATFISSAPQSSKNAASVYIIIARPVIHHRRPFSASALLPPLIKALRENS